MPPQGRTGPMALTSTAGDGGPMRAPDLKMDMKVFLDSRVPGTCMWRGTVTDLNLCQMSQRKTPKLFNKYIYSNRFISTLPIRMINAPLIVDFS